MSRSNQKRIARRTFLKASAALAGMLAAPRLAFAQLRQLSIMINAGQYQDTLTRLVIEPFQKKFNAKVLVTPGSSVEMLAKLRAEKASPSVDLVVIAEAVAVTGRAEGIFEKMDRAKIANMKDVDPKALNPDGFGFASLYATAGILYNTEKVKPAPKTWKDMWNPAYKGGIMGLHDTAGTTGVQFLVQAARMNGGSESNIEPGFKALAELKKMGAFVHSGKPAEITNLFLTDAMLLSPGIENSFAKTFAEKDKRYSFVLPEDGFFPIPYTVEIVTKRKGGDLVYDFMNMQVDAEAQKGFMESILMTPVNNKVAIPKELAGLVPTPDKALVFNWAIIAQNRAAWQERFNKEIAA
ncbi:MAG: extracellular solute-binding protein [Proteobacteria bacterium]|nr:extracellular solute-binding protein [Pseudomonadota bacterium]MBI3498269.1 extracellular solute-binding protein [Pseudomonadota bacterium]